MVLGCGIRKAYRPRNFFFTEDSVGQSFGSTVYLYPKFAPQSYTLTLKYPTFTYEIDGATKTFTSESESYPLDYLFNLTADSITPADIPCHTFCGWYYDKEYSLQFTEVSVTEDMTLEARYTKKSYIVTFVYGKNLDEIAEVTTPFLTVPEPPNVPDIDGKTFSCWSAEPIIATGDTTYVARYTDKYSYFYYADDVLVAKYVSAPLSPENPPEKSDYDFFGYVLTSYDEDVYRFDAVYSYVGSNTEVTVEGSSSAVEDSEEDGSIDNTVVYVAFALLIAAATVFIFIRKDGNSEIK